MDRTRNLEQALGKWVRGKVPFALAEFLLFGLKQAWAATFGGLILCALIITKYLWPEDAILSRYDALFLFCIALQYAMLRLGLETQDEAKLILIFHVTGTVMEIFKVWSESWIYPETAIFAIAGVPLFSGFMYASVGSFIVRVIRAFHMKFAPFPPIWRTWVLAILIYVNFFSHHYIPDARFCADQRNRDFNSSEQGFGFASVTPITGCRSVSPRRSHPFSYGLRNMWEHARTHGFMHLSRVGAS